MGRQLIFCPDVNPLSFVLLYAKGDSGDSWSIRDYKSPHEIAVRYAREFPFTLQELLKRTQHRLAAPATSTTDGESWYRHIENVNVKLLNVAVHPEQHTQSPERTPQDGFPILDEEGLLALTKAAKTSDMKRIRTSPNSEDWVTWNTFALLRRYAAGTWWPELIELARNDQPALQMPLGWQEPPSVRFWENTGSPEAYERHSRARMLGSDDEQWKRRAKSAAPVEGDSEIEVILSNPVITLFIEAKLGSDISLKTSYDPSRNQIARNIDCLLDTCGATQPLFFMLVRDVGSARAYTQLMRGYHNHPSTLAKALPHRDPHVLAPIARNLAMVRWCDLISRCCAEPLIENTAEAVRLELMRRM